MRGRGRTVLSFLVCIAMMLSQFAFAVDELSTDVTGNADNTEQVEESIQEQEPAQTEKTEEADKPAEEVLEKEQVTEEKVPEPKADDKDKSDTMPAFKDSAILDGVKVEVSAEEGTFPKGAVLSVEMLSDADEKKIEDAMDDVREDDVNVALSYSFDIKILDKEGEELQPADGKKADVSFKINEVEDANLGAAVYHMADTDSGLKAEELKSEKDKDVISAETDGFSFYTVEFTYNDLQYVMEGDTSVELADILAKIGLSGEPTDVKVSNKELFSAEKKEGKWMVTAHKAFKSEEWMKVTINDVEYTIVVTDDGSDWLHYSIDLIWDIADDDQKINQTVVDTNSTSKLYPKYKFTIQTSTVDYAPDAMEFVLPLSLFSKRTDLLDKNTGELIVFDPDKFYPDEISITDDPNNPHASSYYYIEDRENDRLIIKNRETVYAGTNATIQVKYALDPDSIYDMSVGTLQATGNCTPTSETPGVVLPPEETTSREITYSLDTGFSSLNIVNTSCEFEQYTLKDGYRYYSVIFNSHPYGNQAYEQFFDFDFLETGGEFVGPLENVESGTTMTLTEASNYYKKTSGGRQQGEDVYHECSNYLIEFYVRYPDTDEVKKDKLKITTQVVGSDEDGYNHEDPDQNDIVSNSLSFENTWVKYPDKPIGDYYKNPIGQARNRVEIFSPEAYGTGTTFNGAARFVMGVGNDSVVGRSGDNNKLVITDTGLVPENDAPEFDYEFTDVYIPLVNVTPKQYNPATQSIGKYTGPDNWYDLVTVEASPDGTNWTELYSGDGKDYNNNTNARKALWYEKGYKKFRITFSGIKENVALTGEFARVTLKSNEYTEEFLSREDQDQYRNWMHVDIINSDDEVDGTVDDWAMLTLTPFSEKASTNTAKNMGKVTSEPENETVYVEFNCQSNMMLGSSSYYAINDKEYLQGFGKEMKKLKEAAPEFFAGLYDLDEFGNGIMYDLLPPGYHFEGLIKSTPPYSKGTGYSINGDHTSKEEIWPEYEVIENYKGTGREMVIFTFPTGAAIEEYDDASIVNVRLELNYKTSIKWDDLVYYQNERNFVATQSENGIPLYNAFPDDGAPERSDVNLGPFQEDLMTDSGKPAYYDVNGDGDTTTENTLYAYVTVSPNVVISTQSGIEKDIMGESGEWCKLDHTDINETYKYRIRISTSDTTHLSDLIIFDTLEEAANTNEWEGEVPWKGIFQSVDTSWLTRHGYDPVVYYSTADVEDLDYNIVTGRENNPWINDSDVWTRDLPANLSEVTAVAVDCRKMADGTDAVLNEGKGVEFEIKMTAPPEYPTLEDPDKIYAYNRPAYSCKHYASYSADPDYYTDIGHRVQIYLEPMIQVSAEKKWKDDSDRDRVRPSSITLHLKAGDEVIATKEVTPDDDGKWKVTFDPVPRLDENNEEIEYTIKEVSVEGYNSSISGNQEDGFTVTNTHIPEKTEVEITKTWSDDSDRDGYRLTPEEFLEKIHLYGNGQEIDLDDEALNVNVTDNEDNTYTVTVDGLFKYEEGEEITYTIEEDEVDKYEGSVKGLNITNKHEIELTQVPVKKVWEDTDNVAELRPESITVRLLADGEETDYMLELNEDNEWSGVFENLVKFNEGQEIKYTVSEDTIDFYNEPVIEGDSEEGYTITNTLDLYTDIETSGTKTWEDNDDALSLRPESINITLLADGEQMANVIVTEEDDWKYNFGYLPKYYEGKEIEYTIEEDPVDGYEATYDGFDITNECTQIKPSTKLSGTLIKEWDDNNDRLGIRPKSVKVHILNGDNEYVDSFVLSKENGWSYEIKDLPEYDDEGKEIDYYVYEEPVEGYTFTKIKEIDDNTAAMVNSIKKGADTGDKNDIAGLIGLMAICAAALSLIALKRRKEY